LSKHFGRNRICQNRVADALPPFRVGSMMKRMSFSETIFLFILALVIFGPKKLPEIARQVGKVLNEFRRASNEFKAQIEQEIHNIDVENKKAETQKQASLPPSSVPVGTASRSAVGAANEGSTASNGTATEGSTATLAASAENPPILPAEEPATEAIPRAEAPNADVSASATSPSNLHAESISASEPVTSSAAQESHV
jgi:sec-independent protein translocase protein TatB